MSGDYRQDILHRTAFRAEDPALARLRTAQVLRAVREVAALGAAPPPRVAGLSGKILEDDDPGGDSARVIADSAASERGGKAPCR